MKRDLAVIVGLCVVLFFLNMNGWDLWNPDEPRYAEVAREMILLKNLAIPHLNGEIYTDKPPLFFWLIAVLMRIFGQGSATAARLPSAIFATATAIITYRFGRFLFNRRVGLLSALVLVTNGEFFWLARRANIDCTLTFFTTLAIVLFWVGLGDRRRGLFFSASFLSMGIGFLAKLQVALIVPVLTLACALFLTNKFFVLKTRSLYISALFFLVPPLCWLIPAYVYGGKEYLVSLFYEKTTAIFFTEISHARPFYYYLENFPVNFLPWFFFFVSAIFLSFRKEQRRDERIILLLSWFFTGFIFFSLSKGKRELYLLPLYPSASLLVGYLFDNCSKGQCSPSFLRIPSLLLGIFLLLAALVLPFLLKARFELYFGRHLITLAAVSLLFFLFALSLLIWGRGERAFQIVTAFTSLGLMLCVLLLFPSINPAKSAKAMSREILKTVGSEDKLAFFEIEGAQFNFYTGLINIRRLHTSEELIAYLKDDRQVFCIMEKKRLREVERGIQFKPVLSSRIGSKEYVLISNR